MLRAGAIVLSIGAGLQCIVSVLSLLASLAGNVPILKMVFTDREIAGLDAKVLATTKSLAILHNAGAVLGTALTLIIIWTSRVHGHKWAFWTLLYAGIWGHAMWFPSARSIGNQTMAVNLAFTVVFLVGIGLAGRGIFK
jgi:hypothetical protein